MSSSLPSYSRQQGLSLVELMIAMVIGLLVLGAVGGVYLSTSRNYTQDEMLSRMQENARFALHVLVRDLSMAGFWGPIVGVDNINTTARSCTSTSTTSECLGLSAESSLSVATDCGPGTTGLASNWATSIDPPLEFSSEVASGSIAHTTYACIGASEFLPGSDILAVKYVEGAQLASGRNDAADVGDVFIRTNGNSAMLFSYATDLNVSEGSGITDWRYVSNLYYVRNYFLSSGDGIPTLVRKKLFGNSMQTEPGGVAQGIEYFHIMFGVDKNHDAAADVYTSTPTAAELKDVTSARIYVLARSAGPDPGYVNDKIYQLGDVTRDFSTSPDHFYRRVFTALVVLRNERNRINISGG